MENDELEAVYLRGFLTKVKPLNEHQQGDGSGVEFLDKLYSKIVKVCVFK